MNYEITRTVNIFKFDRRTKDGEKLFKSIDVEIPNDLMEDVKAALDSKFPSKSYRVEVVNTYVLSKSFIDPEKTFWERYDTPYYCSPSTETYWSM